VKASLILKVMGEDIRPLPIRQAGMFTQESRGIDTMSAHLRSAAMWTIINVSEWSVFIVVGLPYRQPCPVRVSEPRTMMFSAWG
jgi:hypothetical protein